MRARVLRVAALALAACGCDPVPGRADLNGAVRGERLFHGWPPVVSIPDATPGRPQRIAWYVRNETSRALTLAEPRAQCPATATSISARTLLPGTTAGVVAWPMVNVGDSAVGLVRIHLLDGLHGCDLYYRVAAIPEARAMALAPPLLHLARRGEEGAQGSLRAACVLPDTEVADVGPPRVRADGGTWVVPVHRVRSTESRRVIVEVTLDRSLLEPASTFIALSVRVADAEYTGVIDVARGSDGPWRR